MFNSARRCLVLPRGTRLARAPLPPTRALHRSLRNGSLVRRFFVESSSDGGANTAPAPITDGLNVRKELYHIGTVTAKRPGDTDIRSLIDRIQPVPHLMPHSKSPTAMLLVTPSFAAALQPPSDGSAPAAVGQALSRILDHSLDHASPLRTVRVIAAVIDRLPVPRNDPETSKGCEGLAYALWYSDRVAERNWTAQPEAASQDDSVGTLTFDIWDRFRLTNLRGNLEREYSDTIHRLHLPLANTVFQTGHTSIMYNFLYQVSKIDETEHGAPLPERRSLHAWRINRVKYQRVSWPVSGRYLAHEKRFFPKFDRTLHQLQLNFIPLTAPRQVHAGMGNIVRQISDSDEKPAPASQELEKAVSSYFTATGQAPHSMPVWAIVSNERSIKYFSSAMLAALGKPQPWLFSKQYDYAGIFSEYVQDTWSVAPERFNNALWKHILLGNARVHRVLSGGGGWGKKAGLLSLDPKRSFEKGDNDVGDASLVDRDSSMDNPLEEVARPGSYIQFFVSPVSSLSTPGPESGTCAFGVIPSTIDDIPVAKSEGPSDIELWEGYFGALSEQGMGMKFVRHIPGNPEHFSRTIIDVPFSLFVTKPYLSTPTTPDPAHSERAKSKFTSIVNQGNVTRTHGPETNQCRPLHTQAKSIFDPSSRRYFSSSSALAYPKAKELLRKRYGGLRPCVPISSRLRTIKEDEKKPDHWTKTIQLQKDPKPKDLKLTLGEYKHYWKVSRWIVALCQAKFDAMPAKTPAGKKLTRGPVYEQRMLWKRYLEAASAHAEQLREQNFRLLELRVEAVELELQYIERSWRIILKRGAGARWLIQNSVGIKCLRKIWFKIKTTQVAVAPLPFRAREVVQILEQMGHKSQVKCKKWEDSLYAKVLRYRRRREKRKKRMERMRERLSGIERSPQHELTIQAARPIILDSKGFKRVQLAHGRHPIPGRPSPTHSQRRHLSYLPTTPDPTPQHPASTATDTDTDTETTTTTTPVEPAMAAPVIRFHSSQTPSRLINAYTPSLRALFARKRRVRLAQLSLLRRSLARLARTELAYLDQSVYLSRLSLIRLTQQAVAANPAAWPAAAANDERSNEWLRPPPHRLSFNAQRNDVRKRVVEAAGMGLGRPCWPMLGAVGDEVDVMETQIGRLRWSLGRLARIAASGVDEVKRVETGVEKMAAFREMRQGLVEQVRERLRVEERGWRRKGLVNKMDNLRAAEMWYVDKVVLASERELQVAESELEAVVEEIDEEQARRRRELNNREGGLRVGQKVRLVALRNPMDAVMEKRAAQAWALAKDLEDCLGR